MEIVEKHHKLKCDAPSGTAIALADSLNAAMDNQYHYVYDRSQRHEQRDPKEIGISLYAAAPSSATTTSSSQARTRLLPCPTEHIPKEFSEKEL